MHVHPAPAPSTQPAILAAAPRCGARTRAGDACRSPAVHGKRRCRMHGGKGSGAPCGNRNAWKHGGRSAWIRSVARYLRATSPAASGRVFARVVGARDGRAILAVEAPARGPVLRTAAQRPAATAGAMARVLAGGGIETSAEEKSKKSGRTTPCTRDFAVAGW